MNAGAALQAGLVQGLATVTGMRVFDAPPVRGAVPHVVVGAPTLRDWSMVDCTAREGRVVVSVHDEGESPERLWQLIDGVEGALATVMPELGGGWRLVTFEMVGTRVRRGTGLRWVAAIEARVRVYLTQ